MASTVADLAWWVKRPRTRAAFEGRLAAARGESRPATFPRVLFRRRYGSRSRSGFSLVEVLVTLLVLGIGLLGLAAFQITGLRLNDGASLRTRAALAAYDLADRLRANTAAFFSKGQASAGMVAVGPSTCSETLDGSTALSRWQKDFCDLALPPPASGNAASTDCRAGNPCGDGNCAIVVRWSNERAERADAGGGGDVELRVCTRVPTVN